MASVNEVTLIGNLGADPEISFLPSGGAVANLRVATSTRWKDRNTQELKQETEWHRVVCYDKLAEFCGQYLTKGRSVYVSGRLRTRKWTDKDGIERFSTEIVAGKLQSLGSQDRADNEQG